MAAALSILALLAALSGSAGDLRNPQEIQLREGVNHAPNFAGDGRTATIVKAWRDNGNAHGHFLYLVLLPFVDGSPGSDTRAGVVTFDDGDHGGLKDVVTASPFDGERVLGSVRFLKGEWRGRPATLLVRADLGEAASGVLADHAPADVRIYRLERPGVDVGTTPDLFRLVGRFRAGGLYCNADMALSAALGLRLPSDYAGARTPSGCLDS